VAATVTSPALESSDDIAHADRLKAGCDQIRAELRKLIVGQDSVVELILLSILTGGNSLVIGVPGLAKTLLINTFAKALDLKFSRIQFTPDLMPSDITGTEIIQDDPETGRRHMVFVPGPIFANIVLADEINRTPPKTQAALLEAMQEHRVTVQGQTYTLKEPFFVFATQNPIELEGTYPLPEAQLDRFMFEIVIDYLTEDQEVDVVLSTTSVKKHDFKHAVTRTSRPGPNAPDFVKQWVSYGASVRAPQHLILGGKARALMQGRYHVSFDDIRALAKPVLRHRVLLNFHAESERVTSDQVIDKLLEAVPMPRSGM
jgi:MoxR-like ATPase